MALPQDPSTDLRENDRANLANEDAKALVRVDLLVVRLVPFISHGLLMLGLVEEKVQAYTRGLRYSSHTATSGLGLARVVRRFVWPRHTSNDATRSLRM